MKEIIEEVRRIRELRGGGEADEGRDRRSYRKVGLGEEMAELKKEFKKQEAKWKKEREQMKRYIRRLEKEIEKVKMKVGEGMEEEKIAKEKEGKE